MAYYDNEFLKRYYKDRTGIQLFDEYSLYTKIFDFSYYDYSIIQEYLDDVYDVLVNVCAERYLDIVIETEKKRHEKKICSFPTDSIGLQLGSHRVPE